MPHAIDQLGTHQVTVTSAATLIASPRRDRFTLTVVKHGTQDLFYGCDATVTTTTGAILSGTCGQYISLPTTAGMYGIVASGDMLLSITETYG